MATKYIYKWEGDSTQPLDAPFTWKSKRFLMPRRTAFSCARVIAEVGDRSDYYALLMAHDEAVRRNAARISSLTLGGAIGENELANTLLSLNGDFLEEVPAVQDYSGKFVLTFNFYVDGTLLFTKDVYASDVPFRLGDGVMGRKFEVEVTGNVTVERIDVASSMDELKALSQGG